MSRVIITIADTENGGLTVHSEVIHDGAPSATRAVIAASRLLATLPLERGIDITPRKSGHCDLCGAWSGELVEGLCQPCHYQRMKQ